MDHERMKKILTKIQARDHFKQSTIIIKQILRKRYNKKEKDIQKFQNKNKLMNKMNNLIFKFNRIYQKQKKFKQKFKKENSNN